MKEFEILENIMKEIGCFLEYSEDPEPMKENNEECLKAMEEECPFMNINVLTANAL